MKLSQGDADTLLSLFILITLKIIKNSNEIVLLKEGELSAESISIY